MLDIDQIVALEPEEGVSSTPPTIEFDRDGHPTIESLVRVTRHNCPNAMDNRSILKAFTAALHSIPSNQFKDGKISVANWIVTDYGQKKNGQINSVKRMTPKNLCDIITNPTTLRETVISNSFFKSCVEGKLCTVEPNSEDVVDIFFNTVSKSYDLAQELIKNAMYSHNVELTRISSTNLMRITDTSSELIAKKEIWLKNASNYLNYIGVKIDEADLKKALHDQFGKKFHFMRSNHSFVYINTKNDLSYTRDRIERLAADGKIRGKIGAPGTGKTYEAIHECDDIKKCSVISLSNTVAFNGAKRAKKEGIDADALSFSKLNYLSEMQGLKLAAQFEGRNLLIDETSQMGIKDLRTLNTAIDIIEQTGTKLIIMGDLDQIPSFLSRGSVLYSLVTEFPGMFKLLTENHRADPGARCIVDDIQKFSKSHLTKEFDKYRMDRLTLNNFLNDFSDSSVVITGSNYQSALVNQIIMRNKMGNFILDDKCDNWWKLFNINKDSIMDYISENTLRMRSTDTNDIHDFASGKQFKIRTNEEFIVTKYSGDTKVRLESTLDGMSHVINYNTMRDNMEPAYAINSTKAQGLEWDHVVLMYGDIGNSQDNLAFKTNYPIRSTYEHFYVGCSRAKKSLHIFYGGQSNSELTPVEKFNMFEVISNSTELNTHA